VPQVGDVVDAESALGVHDEEAVLVENGEDDPDMLQVFRHRAAVDEDVVEEDEDEAAEESPEHLIHQRLEGGRRITEAERHHQEFILAIVRPGRSSRCRRGSFGLDGTRSTGRAW
jgi:hypothetical protein